MPRKKTAAHAPGLSGQDASRLDSWAIEIAASYLGGVNEEANGEWRVGDNRRLIIHRNGCWHDFADEQTGHGAMSLLVRLHGGDELAALEAAETWLAGHDGDGQLGRASGEDEDEDGEDAEARAVDDAWSTAYVDTLWQCAVKIDGTPGEAYLKSRSLWPLPAGVEKSLRWTPDARGDEGALVAAAADDNEKVLAIQLTHITQDGKKSGLQPVRRTLRGPRDWKDRAAFRIGSPGAPDLVVTEGVEDAISALMAGADRAHACLGAGSLGRAQLPTMVEHVVVCRDDDRPGSPACVALGRGVARLLGQGRKVSVTPRAGRFAAGAKDLNDLLQNDVELARRQLNEAGGLGLFDKAEREAVLDGISRLPQDVYENTRRAVAKVLNWRAGALDDDRRQRRARRAELGDDDPVTKGGRVEPWPDPVTDLGGVLDHAVAQLKRFLIVPNPTYFDTIALWCAHTYLVRNEAFGVGYTPLLTFQSPIKRCGKSTGLKCAHLMSYDARIASSVTPSSLFRVVDEYGSSLMVDEADNVFKDEKSDLLGIMNAGRDRMTARVMRAEAVGDKFKVREFNTFAPIAVTSIKQLPGTLQDRSITLPLRRATQDERPERLTLRTRGPLIDLGRRLTRWAADLKGLPDPDIPAALFNRVEDKWFVLFQVAEVASGEWPKRCRAAALADLAREEANDVDGGRNADLLADVWEVFYQQNKVRMHTDELCEALIAMNESPWGTANHGKPVGGYYLRTHLADFVPDDAEKIAPRKWRGNEGEARGYHEKHLEDAFGRYLGRPLPSAFRNLTANNPGGEKHTREVGSKHPSHPSHPSQEDKTVVISDTYIETDKSGASVAASVAADQERSATDDTTDNAIISVASEHQQNQASPAAATDETDETDVLTPLRAPTFCDPSEQQPASDNSHIESVTEFPRGASGKRRKQPKAEDEPWISE